MTNTCQACKYSTGIEVAHKGKHYCLIDHGMNEGKSAASFYRQVAALVPDMFCNFYLVKNHKTANNSAMTEAKETYLESLELKKWCMFDEIWKL